MDDRQIGHVVISLIISVGVHALVVMGFLYYSGEFDDPDITCASFLTQSEAQAHFDEHGADGFDVVHPAVIDPDDNGLVCERLPTPAKGEVAWPNRLEDAGGLTERWSSLLWFVPTVSIGAFLLFAWMEGTNDSEERSISTLRQSSRPNYRDYLRSDDWRSKRMMAILRAGGRCQLCNRSGHLEVHHRTYERLGDERDDDLIVLCRACHQTFHDNRGMPVRS